jgi:hypothetical protein
MHRGARPRFIRLLSFALAILMPRAASATWPTDPRENVPVCVGPGMQGTPVVATDGAGGAIVVWHDERTPFTSQMYAQHVRADGVLDPAWPVGGRGIMYSAPNAFRPRQAIISDGNGGAIVAWEDWTGPGESIYAQHLRASGDVDPAWPVKGLRLSPSGGGRTDARIISDGAGGAIVSWIHEIGGLERDVYAQHALASGVVDPSWPAGGIPVCTAPGGQTGAALLPDGAGGAFVAWIDARTTTFDFKIYAQHLLKAGVTDPRWPVNGRMVHPTMWGFPVIVSDGGTGAIIGWGGGRLCAQHVLQDGTIDAAWPLEGNLIPGASVGDGSLRMLPDGAGGALLTWQDGRFNGTDVFAGHVLANGTPDPSWPPQGMAICTAPGQQFLSLDMITDGFGGAIVAWEDRRNSRYDLYAQHLPAVGYANPLWPAGGRAVNINSSVQLAPRMTSNGAGGAIFAWQDFRAGNSDIYAQNLNASGTIGGDGPTATLVSLVSAGFEDGTVRIVWRLSEDRLATVYRRDAEIEWQAVGHASPDGTGRIAFEDTHVVGGRYGYRLGVAEGASEEMLGEVWVDVPDAGPQVAWLARSIPNPAGKATLIRFGLPAEARASLRIHDIHGRQVRELASGAFATGEHRASWDLTNDQGQAIDEGIYFVRLITAGLTRVTRVVVVR